MTGRAVVFAGPSIDAASVRAVDPDADVRPPAAHGDLYLAALTAPDAIVLVDGVFDWVRAVWHKEILWALAQGVRVIGAASMGALRAAECAAFGMEPCGVIAADYVRGARTSDGDVAQAHATAEDGWRPLSEALVNVDATLAAATAANVVSVDAIATLSAAGRSCFYADRTWPLVLERAELDDADRRAFVAWLPSGRVDQKRIDAESAIALARAARTVTPAFTLAETTFWNRAAAQMAARPIRLVPLTEV